MAEHLLAGVRVVDLTGEPGQMTGRILADLGAEVVKVEPPEGDPLRAEPPLAGGDSLRFAAWNAGKTSVCVAGPDDPALAGLLAAADVVLTTPGWPGSLPLDPASAPGSVWVSITPFGLTGPKATWRASDLGVMASTGNMYSTGEPDRAPVRCTEPSGYAHTGPEAALAVLTALASGRPQRVDVSMQETVLVANMGSIGRFAREPFRGRRSGAATGRTREIWPCADGWVSFGLRGGKARLANLQLITRLVDEAGLGTPALTERDWAAYNPSVLEDAELEAIQAPIGEYFLTRTMAELYEIACETHLMLAPANSARELYASAQLAARSYFEDVEGAKGLPAAFVTVRSADGSVAPARPAGGVPPVGAGPAPDWSPRQPAAGAGVSGAADAARSSGVGVAAAEAGERSGGLVAGIVGGAGGGAWTGTRILELGSGAAGPIASRYFAEHGATVLRIESKSRPDFLRVYALPNPHGLEGSDMFDALNVGKLGVTLNLKHPKAIELAKRLVHWADAVAENFAPKAMRGFGLDYDTLAAEKPDLVMVSACLQGQTGPHKDYPGFGGQGSALAGFNGLTGWPDRAPLGPSGTITDSLAPRFVATALAAGLLYRRRTGRGVYLDVAQVEAGTYTLAPWLLDFAATGREYIRMGNRSERAAPHGAFPCRAETVPDRDKPLDDRWVAIAVWNDDDWKRLVDVAGYELAPFAGLSGLAARKESEDGIEAALSRWTSARSATEVAEVLQAAGVEAVPVADFGDVHHDPQLATREHFVWLDHPYMGRGAYERNGFRFSDAPSGYARTGPTLGRDNDFIFGEVLGLSEAERSALAADGVFD